MWPEPAGRHDAKAESISHWPLNIQYLSAM